MGGNISLRDPTKIVKVKSRIMISNYSIVIHSLLVSLSSSTCENL